MKVFENIYKVTKTNISYSFFHNHFSNNMTCFIGKLTRFQGARGDVITFWII